MICLVLGFIHLKVIRSTSAQIVRRETSEGRIGLRGSNPCLSDRVIQNTEAVQGGSVRAIGSGTLRAWPHALTAVGPHKRKPAGLCAHPVTLYGQVKAPTCTSHTFMRQRNSLCGRYKAGRHQTRRPK